MGFRLPTRSSWNIGEYIGHREERQNHREEKGREKRDEREKGEENIQDPARTCHQH